MIKSILEKENIEDLNFLFNTYSALNEEKELIKIAGKLLLKNNELGKSRAIDIMDRIIDIVNGYRNIYKNISCDIETLAYAGDFLQVKYLGTCLENLSLKSIGEISKIMNFLKKAMNYANINKNYEFEIYLSLNYADMSRYTCELSYSELERKENIEKTKNLYLNTFNILNQYNISGTNPCSLSAYFNYCIFLYHIVEDKISAIKILKQKHKEIINNLDSAYKKYVDSYDIINKITQTLTDWVIGNNYGGINSLNE